MAYSHGELVNYSNISRDCGVNSKTVREYYQILVDTLVGYLIQPFKKTQNRQVITKSPKFYLFDTGVAGAITKRQITEERGIEFGKAFEHFILMEIMAYNSYSNKDFEISFWRTKTGQEVDFILGTGEVALEVKGKGNIDNKDTRSIKLFSSEFSPKRSIIICNELEERRIGQIRIVPYRKFLIELWAGDII